MFSEGALELLRDKHPLQGLAEQFGVTLRRSGRALVGPCPICSINGRSTKASRFEIKPDGRAWVCAVCQDGGDVIRLVQLVEGKDFRGAVEWLGGAQEVDPETAARVARARAERQARREQEAATYREKERERLFALWNRALPTADTPVEAYLESRGLPGLRVKALRYLPGAVYFHGNAKDETGRDRPRAIHSGPAMLAAIRRPDGKFGGLHFTYLRADGSGKAEIFDPDSGVLLKPRKVRGSQSAGVIALIEPKEISRVFWGEGIETVLSVAQHYRGRAESDAFYSAIDLGNLGGPHAEKVPHPTERTLHNHAKHVPGPDPDFAKPAALMPESMRHLVILGDADSDPFLTRCAVERAAKRYAAPGRRISVAWPPAGSDFNDLVQEERTMSTPAIPACEADARGA